MTFVENYAYSFPEFEHSEVTKNAQNWLYALGGSTVTPYWLANVKTKVLGMYYFSGYFRGNS